MSTPGRIPDSELSTINGGEKLLHVAAKNFALADDKLCSVFGFRMRILTPYGGYRTREEQQVINPGLSPDYSDHCKGFALDVDNQESFRNINNNLFVQIMAEFGWTFNVSNERWHCINNMYDYAASDIIPIVEDEEVNNYGFVRNKDTMSIAIVYPNFGKKRPLKYGEWAGYAAAGAKYADLPANDFNSIPNITVDDLTILHSLSK